MYLFAYILPIVLPALLAFAFLALSYLAPEVTIALPEEETDHLECSLDAFETYLTAKATYEVPLVVMQPDLLVSPSPLLMAYKLQCAQQR